MKRKIYDQLLDWKNQSNGNTALLIDGARRVGKSYIVKEFGQREYKSHIILDFNNIPKQVLELFENYLTDLDTFFMYLGLYYNIKLEPRHTLIVFDEVQLYPRARAAIKYFVADGRYDFIETGSLVSINKNVKDIVIPSEERRINMFPMDFEEFMWAMGEDTLMTLIRHCFNNHKPMGADMHRKAMTLFRQYMIVGGMPQAVREYVSTKDFTRTDSIKRDILALYRNDIRKYASGYEMKVTGIFDEIPAQLQRHEKKFKLADIQTNARMREYESSFFWLKDSMVVNICYGATEPSLGLRLKLDSMTLKCYMADTGLLISLAFDENQIATEELYKKLMLGKLEINEGMLVENIVAQMLTAAGHKLYFFSSYSKDYAEDRMEIDFLIAKQKITSRHNISPIEVKSSNGYALSSLKKFYNKYGHMLSTSYVLHSGDFKEENGICFMPLYMTPLL